jgi:hypothetical protein
MRTLEQRQILRQADAIKRDERKQAKRARPKSEKATRGRELDGGYLAFLRRQPCEARHLGGCDGRIDPAHLRFSDFKVGRINPGKGRKSDDRWALSLCRTHHDQQHAFGDERRWWEAVVRRDPNAIAVERYAQFQGAA